MAFGAEAVCQDDFTTRLGNFIGDCLGIAADSNDIDLASFSQESRQRVPKQAVFGQEKYTDLRGFRAVLYLSHRFFLGTFSVLRLVWLGCVTAKITETGPSEQSLNIVRSNVNQYQDLYQTRALIPTSNKDLFRLAENSHPDFSVSRRFYQPQFRISPSTILVLSRPWSCVSPSLSIPATRTSFASGSLLIHL